MCSNQDQIIMPKLLLIFSLTISLTSCNNSQIDATSQFVNNRNSLILDFKIRTVMTMDELVEVSEKKYKELSAPYFNSKTDTIRFKNNKIYI